LKKKKNHKISLCGELVLGEAANLPQEDTMIEYWKTANNLSQNIHYPSQIFKTVTSVTYQRRKNLRQTRCNFITNTHKRFPLNGQYRCWNIAAKEHSLTHHPPLCCHSQDVAKPMDICLFLYQMVL
jgi:hypothetical protein